MTWFAFTGLNGGQAVNLAGSQEKQAVVEGFHGYATQAQAQAAPNATNVITRVFADGWIVDYKAAVAEKAAPGQSNASILNPATAASAAATGVATEAENAIPGLADIGGAFHALTTRDLWIRAAKILFGGALLIIGVAHITGSSDAVSTAARKVPIV